jgi:hypothetical protein
MLPLNDIPKLMVTGLNNSKSAIPEMVARYFLFFKPSVLKMSLYLFSCALAVFSAHIIIQTTIRKNIKTAFSFINTKSVCKIKKNREFLGL